MPRIARKDIVASYIHVITQGINKEGIFFKDEYKKEYIKLVQNTFEKYQGLYLLCYCIMDNHAHFLIYTKDESFLSKAMASINTTYGIFYNKKEERVGYVFRNRYYTQAIKNEEHLHNAIVYIHRNPVKAKLVNKMQEYQYSSYQQYEEGKMDKECIQLLFNTQGYKKQFDFIHKNFKEKGDIFDIEKYQKDLKKVEKFLEEYCKEKGIQRKNIKKDNFLILQIVTILKDKYLCNNKEISKILGIGKNRITNIKKRD